MSGIRIRSLRKRESGHGEPMTGHGPCLILSVMDSFPVGLDQTVLRINGFIRWGFRRQKETTVPTQP